MNQESADWLVEQGIQAANEGRNRDALDLLQKAAEADPESVDAHYNLGVLAGRLYLEDARVDELYEDISEEISLLAIAKSAYERVLELEPEHVEALNNLEVLRGSDSETS